MASRNEVVAVSAAGLVQGVALVTFPAASSILTSPSEYGLTSTAYGALFLPLAAVIAVGMGVLSFVIVRRRQPVGESGQSRQVVDPGGSGC